MSDQLAIGIVCYPSVGGSGILATQLGQLLAGQGHQVHFISYEPPVRLDLDRSGLFFHQVEVKNHDVFCSPDYTLPLAVKISQVCGRHRLDILHVHYAVPHATAALLARSMLEDDGPGIVTTLHGTDVTLLGADPAYGPAIAQALKQSDAVTAVSHSLAEQTRRQFEMTQIEVVYNFTTPGAADRHQVRAGLGLKPAQVVALHASNLRPLKRVDLVLRAFARSGCDHLLLLGPAGAHPELETGVASRVTLVDAVDSRPYMAACDLGLYASERESFGLAILETMAAGRPVVATRVGGIPEVVGDTGLLCEAGDHRALAGALDTLVADPARRRQLGEKARARADQFSAQRALDGYLAVYRRVLESR